MELDQVVKDQNKNINVNPVGMYSSIKEIKMGTRHKCPPSFKVRISHGNLRTKGLKICWNCGEAL